MILKVPKSIKKKVSSEWFLKTFTFLRILVGCYCNVRTTRLVHLAIRLYCVSVALMVVSYISNIIANKSTPLGIHFSEYIIVVVINFVYADDDVKNFCSNIKINDKILGTKKLPLISNWVYLMVLPTIVIGSVDFFIRFTTESYLKVELFITRIMALTLDLNQLKIIIIFSIMQSRMKQLRNFLESDNISINFTGRDEVASSIRRIRKTLHHYDSLLDIMRRLDKQLQLTVSNMLHISDKILCTYYFVVISR